MECKVEFPATWVDATKFDLALRSSGGPHESRDAIVLFIFPTNCKIMVDAAIRLLSLANCARLVMRETVDERSL